MDNLPQEESGGCGAGKEEAFYTHSNQSLRATCYWRAAMEWFIYPDVSQFPGLDSSATHTQLDLRQRDLHVSE